MTASKKSADRRIQRTRQVLQHAFKEVVHEKSFTAAGIWGIEKGFMTMSIQDITERANVNRGTFYLHFADKYMLADAVIREEFHNMLRSTLPATPQWDNRTLHLLIQVMLDSFEQKYHHQYHASHVLIPLLERATHEELTKLLCTWLKQKRNAQATGSTQLETIARVVSWTIFGATIQWSQEEMTASSEQMTNAIMQIVMEGTGHLVSDLLSE